MNRYIFAFIGAPGCGKSTQARLLAHRFNFTIIDTGQLIRDSKDQKIKDIQKTGKLIPSEIAIEITENEIKKVKKDSIILPGAMRELPEVKWLSESYKRLGFKDIIVFFLDLSDEDAIKRLLARDLVEKRNDEGINIAKVRLQVYHQNTKPIIEYYNSHPEISIHHIDASPSEEQIFKKINHIVKNLL